MKRKRLISIIGLFLCIASSLCLFSACNDDTHTHNYITEAIAPTCEEQGYTIYTCACGNRYNADYTFALGHNFVNYVSNNDATYEADGTKTAVCEREGCNVTDTKIDVGSILTHTHNYDTEVIAPTCTEQGYTIYTCNCGNSYNANYTSALGHNFVNYVSNNDATYEADGTKTAVCERDGCNVTDTKIDVGSILTHTHKYTTEIVAPTCTEQGYTIYSCACGNSYNADYTSALGHNFVNYVYDGNATCTVDGTKTAKCERCTVADTVAETNSKLGHDLGGWYPSIAATCTAKGEEKSDCSRCSYFEARETNSLGHNFVNYVSNNDATYEADGTKTATCERTGCDQTNTIADVGSMLVKNGIVFKTLTLNSADNTVYGKVANGTQVFSFLNEIQVLGNSSYTVSTDITGINIIPTKTVPLIVGDNVFYVLADNQNNDLVLYTITIRVRPLYTVTFNTQSENNVESQSVEEDSFATMPSDRLEKTGYSFIGWDFDFATPINENITIMANWKANEYTISFDGNGVENPESIVVTYDDTYEDLPMPERDGYTFNGWFTRKDDGTQIASTDKVRITDDQTLYAYWTINTYFLSITKNINDAGTIKTNVANGTYEYLTEVTYEMLTTNLGYNYLGLYDGETLITTDVSYTFVLPANNVNYTAKWQVKEEMSNFYFTSTTTTCVVNGLKNKNATKIVIPDYVSSIESYAFNKESSLISVELGNSVTNIEGHTFEACCNLTSITLGPNVTSIGYEAFYGCSSLTSITIPERVSSIEQYAFSGCCALAEINFNATAMENLPKDNYVFKDVGNNCAATVVNIAANVNKIPAYLFNSMPSTTIVSVKFSTGSICTSIGAAAFSGCIGLVSINMPNSIINIGGSAFSGCIGLVSVNMPNSIINIEDSAFYNCSNLLSIDIPDKVSSIGKYAFYGCTGLTDIAIPDSVTSMGYYAFWGCTSLSICCETSSKPSGWSSVWADDSCTVIWNCAGTMVTQDGVKYALTNDNTMVVYGCNDTVTKIEIANSIQGYSVTAIHERAFYGNKNLTSLIIGDSVANIGDFAFYNCSGLTVIEVITGNNNYHSDGNCLIETATNTLILGCMNSIIPTDGSVTNIGSYSFYGCIQLTTITIPNSVTKIEDYVFYNCSNLSNVTIGTGVTSIGEYSFYNCDLLKNITIPSNVEKIGKYAFAESGIVSVTFEGATWWFVNFSNGSRDIGVTNPTANAGNLRSTYCSYSWSKPA